MGKILKAEEKNRVLSDEEVVAIVKSCSSRYKALDVYTGLNDTDFFGAYLHFNEVNLPSIMTGYTNPEYPQLTANMFTIVEQKICRELQDLLLQRFELIKSYNRESGRNSIKKSMMGKALIQSMK